MLKYAIIGIFSCLIAAWLYVQTQPRLSRKAALLLAFLRALSMACILLLLISPILYYREMKLNKPKIVSLLDSSNSMKLSSGGTSKESYTHAKAIDLAKLFRESGYETESFKFAQGLEGESSSSLLAPSLVSLAERTDLSRVQGIILASDAWLRDEDLGIINRMGIPFYVVADTARTQNSDLVVQNTRNNRYAYRNEPTLLRAELQAQNWSGPATVKLLISGNLAATRTVNLVSGQTASADFTTRFPRTGLVNYRVEISAPGIQERTIANNSYPGAIEVLADKERIVMISDSPGWDNKFILDVIGENNRWSAEHYNLRSGRLFRGETAVASISSENMAALVVINNGALELTDAILGFIKEAHQRGTGIFWQGAPPSSLQDVLPIGPSNVTAAYNGFLTWLPAAAAYPMLSLEEGETGKIPPIDYHYVIAKRSAETLVAINNPQASPAIVVDNGSSGGKVMALAFLNLWKWQLQGSSGAYKRLVSESLTWLGNRSNGSFQPLFKSSYFMGEEILIRLRADDSIRRSQLDMNPRLKIMNSEDQEVLADYLTQEGEEYFYKAILDKPGDYRFEIRDAQSGQQATGRFSLSSDSIEDRDYDYNLPLLSWIASESGGRIVDSSYRPVPAQAEERIESRELAIYRKWYLISLFILAFCLELFFRRRWGLL